MSEVEPCPKCGSTNVSPDQFNSVTRNRWTMSCMDCDWSTATHETEADARTDWNTRAALSSQAQPDEAVERRHVMPGDPEHLGQTALQWYLNFGFGYPHSVRESNIAVESFKDGYRASGATPMDEARKVADPAALREAREAWLEHLRETCGNESVWGRTNDILDGREDGEDFIAGYLAAIRESGDVG